MDSTILHLGITGRTTHISAISVFILAASIIYIFHLQTDMTFEKKKTNLPYKPRAQSPEVLLVCR